MDKAEYIFVKLAQEREERNWFQRNVADPIYNSARDTYNNVKGMVTGEKSVAQGFSDQYKKEQTAKTLPAAVGKLTAPKPPMAAQPPNTAQTLPKPKINNMK